MSRGRKFLAGFAEVLKDGLTDKHRADLQAARDEKLHGYRKEESKIDFENRLEAQAAATADEAMLIGIRGEEERRTQKETSETRHTQAKEILSLNYNNQIALADFTHGLDDQERQLRLQTLMQDKALKEYQLNSIKTSQDLLDQLTTAAKNGANDPVYKGLLEAYYLRNPDAREKITIIQKRDSLGEYIDEFVIFQGANEITGATSGGGIPVTPDGKIDAAAVDQMYQKGFLDQNTAQFLIQAAEEDFEAAAATLNNPQSSAMNPAEQPADPGLPPTATSEVTGKPFKIVVAGTQSADDAKGLSNTVARWLMDVHERGPQTNTSRHASVRATPPSIGEPLIASARQ